MAQVVLGQVGHAGDAEGLDEQVGEPRRHGVEAGALPQFLELHRGGIKAVVAAERAQRRPTATVDLYAQVRNELRARPVLAQVAMAVSGTDEFVVLLARRDGDTLSVVAQVEGALVQQAIRKAAA